MKYLMEALAFIAFLFLVFGVPGIGWLYFLWRGEQKRKDRTPSGACGASSLKEGARGGWWFK